ncbi:MAG TPA: TMEM175 family protein [Gammaproteobacteria bacterium]|nr:TMEM175 family protein [Gammaproteobacteria bacterium]
MNTSRMEAFSDGVIAIIITIMVLGLMEVRTEGAAWTSLKPVLPAFLSYVLSFVYVGIYWNNHHHMLRATRRVNGRILWANLHLLFWLSLFPFVTAWAGENRFATVPSALYGVVLLMAAIAYVILQRSIIAHNGRDSLLAQATGKDLKGKASMFLYVAGIGLSFANNWAGNALYVLVAIVWLVPDRRIESRITE